MFLGGVNIIYIGGSELYSFILVVFLMIISPGPNQVLVIQSGIVLGPKAAALNVAGVASSMFLHASLAGLGISLLILKSPDLYASIQTIGAAYIIYLGVTSLVQAYRLYGRVQATSQTAATLSGREDETRLHSFAKGFTSNVFNIQTSFIFLAIYPQYMDPHHSLFVQSLMLTAILILMLLAWYALFISFIGRIRGRLLQPRTQSGAKRVTGSLLIILGFRLLLT